MNYTYRIYPDVTQQTKLLEWLEVCRGVYNYALRELKDWIASRKCSVDRCSLEKEYIIPANEPFPSYHRQQNNLPNAHPALLLSAKVWKSESINVLSVGIEHIVTMPQQRWFCIVG
jgi:putative transposase